MSARPRPDPGSRPALTRSCASRACVSRETRRQTRVPDHTLTPRTPRNFARHSARLRRTRYLCPTHQVSAGTLSEEAACVGPGPSRSASSAAGPSWRLPPLRLSWRPYCQTLPTKSSERRPPAEPQCAPFRHTAVRFSLFCFSWPDVIPALAPLPPARVTGVSRQGWSGSTDHAGDGAMLSAQQKQSSYPQADPRHYAEGKGNSQVNPQATAAATAGPPRGVRAANEHQRQVR